MVLIMGEWIIWKWRSGKKRSYLKYEECDKETVEIIFPVKLFDFNFFSFDDLKNKGVIEWCNENIENDVTNCGEIIYFKTEEDAAFFKLRWI